MKRRSSALGENFNATAQNMNSFSGINPFKTQGGTRNNLSQIKSERKF